MHRLFTAIAPPREFREHLRDMMEGVEHARWQMDDQLHITTRYIGEVERPVAEDIAHALQEIRAEPLQLFLRGIGSYDRKGRTTELWLAVRPLDAISALHRKIDNVLIRMGLPPEGRAYRPHLTIARFSVGSNADVRDFVARHSEYVSKPIIADWFGLFESKLGNEYASYSLINRYPLNGD